MEHPGQFWVEINNVLPLQARQIFHSLLSAGLLEPALVVPFLLVNVYGACVHPWLGSRAKQSFITSAPAFPDVQVAPASGIRPPVTLCRLPDLSVPCLAALASAAHQRTAAL